MACAEVLGTFVSYVLGSHPTQPCPQRTAEMALARATLGLTNFRFEFASGSY